MKSQSNLSSSLSMFFYKIYLGMIIRVQKKIFLAISGNAYIKANSLFPDATLAENRQLAVFVSCNILDRSNYLKDKEEKKELIEPLRESLFSDGNVIDMLANYFLIECFYFSIGNEDGHNKSDKEKADKALSKAKSYKNTVEPISVADVNSINKKIKQEIKILKRTIKRIKSIRVEKEMSKIIKPIKITPSTMFLFISGCPSLVLIGGILYTKILLDFLGINSSDFFDTSDYIASSVDIIFPVLLSVGFGMFFYFQSVKNDLSEITAAEQSGIKLKNNRVRDQIVITIFCGMFFFVELIYSERFSPWLLFPPALFAVTALFFSLLKIDEYVENRFIFSSVVVSVSGFLIIVFIYISEDLYEIKSENYESPYIISFTEEYKDYSDHAFFLANSKYVFLLNKKTKETVVIPKTGIKSIQTKKEL